MERWVGAVFNGAVGWSHLQWSGWVSAMALLFGVFCVLVKRAVTETLALFRVYSR